MGRLRAIGAIFTAAAGLDAKQTAALHLLAMPAEDAQPGFAKSDRITADDTVPIADRSSSRARDANSEIQNPKSEI
jgi:hypothetical protein